MEKLSNKVVTSYRVVGATKIDAPVKGAKAGDKPRQPKIAKDSVSSLSTAKILYGLNDGEISGIVGGAKGIFLENTPLEDEAGNSNFEGIKWDFRAGTIDQEYIEGFPDLSNEIGVGIELKSTTAWIRAISNTALSAVRIRLSWNGLRKTNTENGDVSGYKIEYAIDIKTTSGAYQEVLRTNINDKVTGKYERTHRIELPKSSNGWQIRVRRITPNANLDHILDKMYIEAITEVIDQKFTYPHTTLLGLQYDATTFSNIAKLAVRAKGKLIKIPTNYDSVSNKYSGVWNGQFKLAYSDNPAWIFYDLVLSDRYGLGRRIDASMVDKWALYSISQYCDELVDDGEGGLEKRYSCNVYLQSQEDAYKVLSQLAGIFRGLTYWSGQQLVLSADVPKEPSYTFSRSNVIDGEFEYSGTALNDRHTVAKVAWDNPKENFKTEYEIIRDEEAISQFGINELTLAAIGCTSRGQAQRAGLWALKSEQLETETVSFRTGLEGFNLVVGEVIEVSDSLLAGRENGGRIVATASDLKSVTIDRDAIVKVNDFISVNAKDGTSQRRKVIAVSGRLVTVLTPFVGVEAGAVWAVSSIDLNTMLFRVMSIKPDEDHIYTITAIQHEPLKYDAVDFGADVKPTNISILKPTNVEPPATVEVSARYRVVQAQSVATLVIQWSQVKDAVAYSVEWRRNSGNWIKIPNTTNVSAEVDGVYAGDYQVRVKSINAFDVESNYITSSITPIAGKVGNPKALASLSATGLLFGMSISWNFQAGSEDTNYTEIEVATDASGANTATLGSFSYPTNKTEVTGLQGGLTLHYRGRIVDKLGNVSEWSQWVSGTTSEDADKVLDLLADQITESQLYTGLKDKIGSIDTNKTILDELSTEVNAQIAEANNDILAANALIETNKQAANAAINEANDDIAEIRTVIDSNLLSTNTAINNANLVISNNKTEFNTALNTVNNKIDTNKTATNSAIAEANVLINANKDKLILIDSTIESNRTVLNTEIQNTKDIIASETINRHNEIVAEAEARVLEDGKLRDSIVNESQARQTATGALTTQFNGIYAQVNPKLIGDETDLIGNESNFVGVWSEQSARIEGDLSLGIRVDGLVARTDTNTASITEQYKVLTDKDKALASSITTLSTDFNNNKSTVNNTLLSLSNTDSTLASSISTLETNYNNNKAAVNNQITVLTNKDKSLTDSITSLTATVGTNTASISNNYTTLVNADTALSTSIGSLETAYNANKASVNNALTVLTNKDKSLAEDITTLNSNVDNNTATITSNYNTLVNKDTALTNSLNTLDADYKGNKSKVATDIIALVNADTATNNLLTTLDSDYKTNKASVNNSLTTLTNKDTALTNSVNTLTTEVGKNKTAISTEATTRSTEDTALSNRITTVSGKTDNALSRITTAETTIASNTQSIAQARTDLTANYTTAINNLEIGGRNLIQLSTISLGKYVIESTGVLGSAGTHAATDFIAISSDSDYTLSELTNKLYQQRVVYYDESKAYISGSLYSGSQPSTLKLHSPINAKFMRISGDKGTGRTDYTKWKLEKGTKATDYTIAPEDTDLALSNINTSISTESIARADADSAITSTVNTLKSDYDTNKASVNNSLTTLTNKDTALTNSITSLTSTVGTNTANISSNYKTLVNKDTALTESINSLSTEYNNNKSTVSNKLTVLTDKDAALTSSIDSLTSEYNTNKAKIVTDLKTLSDKDIALTSSINTLNTSVAGNTASITNNYNTLSNANAATATKLDGVFAQVNPTLIGDDSELIGNDTKFSGVWSEQSARIEEDLALSLRSDNLASQLADNKALISQNYTTLVNADLATASLITSLKTDYEGNKTSVSNSLTALSNKDTSLTNSITLLTSDYNNNKTSVSNTLTSLADKDITLANSITALDTAYKDNKTRVSNSLTALSNEDTVLGSRITTLDTDYKSNKTSVSNSLTALSNKDISLASDITLLKTKTDNTNAEVNTAKTAISNNTSSIAQAKTELTTSYTNAISSAISSEATARTTADTALSGRIDTLTTTVGTNTSAIQTEASTRASADTANANLITTVQSTVAGHTSSIQSQSTAINGLSAQWTMKLDVNGYVSGVGQYNNGTTSQFAILADKFYIANPNTDTTKALFQVLTQPTTINGVTVPSGMYLNGDFIATGSITGNKIRANTSITAPTINGGQININNKFLVDSAGNLLAKSGTFEGTVLANQISGTIDIATMKRSAWTAGYKLFIIKDLASPKNTPSDFNSVRQYSSLIPSYGGLSWSTGSDSNASEIGGAMFEIEIDVAQATTVTQKAFVIDNLLKLYVNNNYIGQYNDRHPDASNGGLISYNLVKGVNKIQYILVNNGSECSLSLLGDFIDNYNVKFN